MLARLLRPLGSAALYGVAADGVMTSALLREFRLVSCRRALLFEGTEGEAFADPRCGPRREFVADGECHALFDSDPAASSYPATLSGAVDAHATAAWIQRALSVEAPLPWSLVKY